MKKKYTTPQSIVIPLMIKAILADSLDSLLIDETPQTGISGDAKRRAQYWDDEEEDEDDKGYSLW